MKKTTLFLLRTYNDIDHIAPIIWKSVVSKWPTYFLFVDQDYSNDYRVRFVLQKGALLIKNRPIVWYHRHVRRLLVSHTVKRVCDRMMAYSFGLYLLRRYKIQVVVTEWSGPFGRERAEYFIRAAVLLEIPVYSLPHGYFLFLNSLFNRYLTEYYKVNARFPNFNTRNLFTRYVVQSLEHKLVNMEYGMAAHKLVVLGSARFCEEWSVINNKLLYDQDIGEIPETCSAVLFFLPHWDYNVHRNQCISLLSKISNLPRVTLIIKAHTRGTGALSVEERNRLGSTSTVIFAKDSIHSASLVSVADIVINFGSSVGFEALRQKKVVINPTYLHDNDTFFDDSGAVYDVTDEASVLKCIKGLQNGEIPLIEQSKINQFLMHRVDGGVRNRDVLQDYLDLLSGYYQKGDLQR